VNHFCIRESERKNIHFLENSISFVQLYILVKHWNFVLNQILPTFVIASGGFSCK
jgi:hypothetical protein